MNTEIIFENDKFNETKVISKNKLGTLWATG